MKTLKTIILTLVIVGGLNWGLVGLFSFDLVATIFGEMSIISKMIYALVGFSAVALAYFSFVKSRE